MLFKFKFSSDSTDKHEGLDLVSFIDSLTFINPLSTIKYSYATSNVN